MSKGLGITIAVILVIVLIAVVCGGSFLGHRMTLVSEKEKVNAQYVSNKSEYDNMWKTFVEMAQVTDKQAEQMKELYSELIAGRNEKDTQVLFKMIQEDNPKLDASVYTELQRQIASGRKAFSNSQKQIADIIREYNTNVQRYFIAAPILGFTTLDANQFIVTSEKTENAFDTKKDDVIDLNGK